MKKTIQSLVGAVHEPPVLPFLQIFLYDVLSIMLGDFPEYAKFSHKSRRAGVVAPYGMERNIYSTQDFNITRLCLLLFSGGS